MAKPPDQAERDRAIAARDQTVLIDAGAGAGKTTLLVARILALIAPPTDTDREIALTKIAAVTFTRRAAGELRLRVRQSILKELTNTGLSAIRRRRLLDALGSVDAAALGTIHGFADRLLRLQPMKARLSPAYQIADDIDAFVDETYSLLLHSVQNGTLAAELEGVTPAYATEVERTFQEVLRAGLLVTSYERPPLPPKVGLDLLVRGFIEYRDRELTWKGSGAFDLAAFKRAASALLQVTDGIDDGAPGARWLVRLAARVEDLLQDPDPVVLYELVARIKSGLKRFKKTKHFTKKSAGQDAWVAFDDDDGLATQLMDPLQAAIAGRLARTREAVVLLYEKVKARHEALDSIDLLLTLRDLLRDDLEARAFYQQRFEHILVDELQDTDPLQAEIILYLSEKKPKATRWQDIVVAPGRLTLVGDPKQSIYRFRRADIGMYQQIRDQIGTSDHLAVTLTANFRSTSALIAWANDRFADVLGTSKDRFFDPATGQVFHQPQLAGEKVGTGPSVHALTYAFSDGAERNAPESRELEGATVAAYLRWLVGRSDLKVRDPDTNEEREIRWSDIAVLALVTSNVRLLFDQFDGQGVPYAMAGGVLFTTDPLHQQFLLGLRAIADRNDGVAEAALLRAPFFAVDLLDLIREKAKADDAAASRATAARAWVRDARRQRFSRSPGQTARALLEETGLGRAVALGPNGEQRLRHLQELCLHLEVRAAAEGLDYDGVTARLRDWIEHPPKLDPPRPVGVEAVQVLTVHQAKGLEFPVVVLWDGMGQWRPHDAPAPWRVDSSATGWAMKTNDVSWEEPANGDLLERERQYAASERRRLVYVAATRARDLLIIPKPAWEQDGEAYIHARLLDDAKPAWVQAVDTYVEGKGARWSKKLPAPDREIRDVNDADVTAQWLVAKAAASNPRQAPRSVTAIAKAPPAIQRIDDTEVANRPPRPVRVSRFGSIFGDTVHQAIGLVLARGMDPRAAVARAAQIAQLTDHHDEAVADVERALKVLKDEALVGGDRVIRLEYPVATAQADCLANGYIDLVSASITGDLAVIDFKTDQWPAGATDALSTFPEYAAQVRAYAAMVGAQRAGLLFTVSGRLAWIS